MISGLERKRGFVGDMAPETDAEKIARYPATVAVELLDAHGFHFTGPKSQFHSRAAAPYFVALTYVVAQHL